MPKIKQLRKSQNLNAMELAENAGLDLNQPLMSAVESGKVLFTPDDLKAVCEALQCTPLDLFDNADEFDLMAVQRKFETLPDDGSRMVKFKNKEEPIYLPPPNPKRSFRMSDKDYSDLMYLVLHSGFNTLSNYLRHLAKETNIAIKKQA